MTVRRGRPTARPDRGPVTCWLVWITRSPSGVTRAAASIGVLFLLLTLTSCGSSANSGLSPRASTITIPLQRLTLAPHRAPTGMLVTLAGPAPAGTLLVTLAAEREPGSYEVASVELRPKAGTNAHADSLARFTPVSAEPHIICNQPCGRPVATSVRFPAAVGASRLIATVRSDICESPRPEPGPPSSLQLRSLRGSSTPLATVAAQLAAIAEQPCRTVGSGPPVTELSAAELTAPANPPRLELNLCAAGVSVRTLSSWPADVRETPALSLAAVQCTTAAPLRSERWAWSDPAPIPQIGSEPPTALKLEAVHGAVEVLIDFAGEELAETPPLECEQTCALAASIETQGRVGHRIATFIFAPAPARGPSGEIVIATIAVASNHEMPLPPRATLRSLSRHSAGVRFFQR